MFFVVFLVKSAPLALFVFDTKNAHPGRLPDGWRIKVVSGTPEATMVSDGRESVLHLKSRSSSYGLERAVDADTAQYPYLSWRWKVTDLPRGGDLRSSSTDDQAAQLLVAFNDRHILAYIWDTTAPKDLVHSASPIPFVHIYAFVCQSGPAQLSQWITETRNVAADYERVFGRRPTQRVKGIRLQINSQHTGTSAESFFGDIAFRNTP
ncbi:MAG: DUF3047 domain-containing protein [Acidobacteriota bacterium]